MLFFYAFQINMVNALAVRALGFGLFLWVFFFLPMSVLNNCINRNF